MPGTNLATTESQSLTEVKELTIDPRYIQESVQSLALLRQLTKEVLTRGRDYGRTQGIPQEYLWDSGASQIIGAYRCHVGPRRIVDLRMTPINQNDTLLSIIVEIPLIHNFTGKEVGNGIGAASTLETKYKYRWEENPEDWGFTGEAIKALKTKEKDNIIKYRIPNPEHGELLNTITKMASKRGEVDAASALPGVASALKELFEYKARKEPDWAAFWAKTVQMGLKEDEVHKLLDVKSLQGWLSQGKTLDHALDTITKALKDLKAAQKTSEPGVEPTKQDIPDFISLTKFVWKKWGIQPAEVWKALGYGSQAECSMLPWDAYQTIKALKEDHPPE